MRTTVDIKPEHRDALMALAARRGEKGFSSVLAEAIEEYLDEEKTRVRRRKESLSLAGSLSTKEARSLRGATIFLRENWR
jgi:metal-responsive CopG/Arc/MetJ family transcriptional regulator